MELVALILIVTVPIHGLFMLATLRSRQMNQYILNDAISALRSSRLSRGR